MDIDDLRREAIRCRNLGNNSAASAKSDWYLSRAIRLTRAADMLTAQTAAAPPAPESAQ
jgi:hypothetical protein